MQLKNRTVRMITGSSILLMALTAGFSFGYVHSGIFVQDDPSATLELFVQQKDKFVYSLAGWCLIVLLDLIVSWGVFRIYRDQHRSAASLTGALRMLYTLLFAYAISALFGAHMTLQELNAEDLYGAFIDFEKRWSAALIVFGIHLITLAIPVWSLSALSRVISLLLAIAGAAYAVVYILQQFAEFQELAKLIEQPAAPVMALGELLFAVYLLYERKARRDLA